MTLTDYARLVAHCRDVQRKFFRGDRSPATLSEAKRLESDLDRRTGEILDGQGSLFAQDAPGCPLCGPYTPGLVIGHSDAPDATESHAEPHTGILAGEPVPESDGTDDAEPSDAADAIVARRPWHSIGADGRPAGQELSDYGAWEWWIAEQTEQQAPDGMFVDPSELDHRVAIGLYCVMCKLADRGYAQPDHTADAADLTSELMEAAEDFGIGLALDAMARLLGSEITGPMTVDQMNEKVVAIIAERDGLRRERDALISAGWAARVAIQDTIRRPMGVVPDSAVVAIKALDAVLNGSFAMPADLGGRGESGGTDEPTEARS